METLLPTTKEARRRSHAQLQIPSSENQMQINFDEDNPSLSELCNRLRIEGIRSYKDFESYINSLWANRSKTPTTLCQQPRNSVNGNCSPREEVKRLRKKLQFSEASWNSIRVENASLVLKLSALESTLKEMQGDWSVDERRSGPQELSPFSIEYENKQQQEEKDVVKIIHASYKKQIAELEMVKNQLLQNNERLKTELKERTIDPTEVTEDIKSELKMMLGNLVQEYSMSKTEIQDSHASGIMMTDELKELVRKLKEEIEKMKLEKVDMQNKISKFVDVFSKINRDKLEFVLKSDKLTWEVEPAKVETQELRTKVKEFNTNDKTLGENKIYKNEDISNLLENLRVLEEASKKTLHEAKKC